MDVFTTLISSLETFLSQIVLIIPKVLLGYVLWLIGIWLINTAMSALDILEVEKWKIDDKIRSKIKVIFVPVAKGLLVLVILDTLGIGSGVIAAILSSVTLAIAITTGLAFGKALEEDAKKVVSKIKEAMEK
jgi:H+/Cl- antiporter ClcA